MKTRTERSEPKKKTNKESPRRFIQLPEMKSQVQARPDQAPNNVKFYNISRHSRSPGGIRVWLSQRRNVDLLEEEFGTVIVCWRIPLRCSGRQQGWTEDSWLSEHYKVKVTTTTCNTNINCFLRSRSETPQTDRQTPLDSRFAQEGSKTPSDDGRLSPGARSEDSRSPGKTEGVSPTPSPLPTSFPALVPRSFANSVAVASSASSNNTNSSNSQLSIPPLFTSRIPKGDPLEERLHDMLRWDNHQGSSWTPEDIFHTFFNTFIQVQPNLIGVQFIKMTASFIHNDLQSCWEDAGQAGWPWWEFQFWSRLAFLGHHQYPPVCPQSLFFITRCHQICSPIKIFTLITISYQGMPVPTGHRAGSHLWFTS